MSGEISGPRLSREKKSNYDINMEQLLCGTNKLNSAANTYNEDAASKVNNGFADETLLVKSKAFKQELFHVMPFFFCNQ